MHGANSNLASIVLAIEIVCMPDLATYKSIAIP